MLFVIQNFSNNLSTGGSWSDRARDSLVVSSWFKIEGGREKDGGVSEQELLGEVTSGGVERVDAVEAVR
jgi:hypothetical protein